MMWRWRAEMQRTMESSWNSETSSYANSTWQTYHGWATCTSMFTLARARSALPALQPLILIYDCRLGKVAPRTGAASGSEGRETEDKWGLLPGCNARMPRRVK